MSNNELLAALMIFWTLRWTLVLFGLPLPALLPDPDKSSLQLKTDSLHPSSSHEVLIFYYFQQSTFHISRFAFVCYCQARYET